MSDPDQCITSKIYSLKTGKRITCRFLNTLEKGILISCWSMHTSLHFLQSCYIWYFQHGVRSHQDPFLPWLQTWWNEQPLPSPVGTHGSSTAKWLSSLLTTCSKTCWRPVETYPPTFSNACDHFCLHPSTRSKGQWYTSFLKLKMSNAIYNCKILGSFYHLQCSYSKWFNCVTPLCPSQQAHNTYYLQ